MKPYNLTKYSTVRELIDAVMVATDLDEVERMIYVWYSLSEEQKEAIKNISVNLYYCILSAMDERKTKHIK